jgi:hypothetical protein
MKSPGRDWRALRDRSGKRIAWIKTQPPLVGCVLCHKIMRVRFIKQHFGSLYCRILRQREDTPYFAPRCVIHRQIMTIDPLTDVPGLLGWKSLVWICHDCENTGHRAQQFHPPPPQSVPLWRGGTQLAMIVRCDEKKWVFASTPNLPERPDAPARSFPADRLSSSEPQRRVPPFPRGREASPRAFPSRRPRLCPIGGRASRCSRRTKESQAVIDLPSLSAMKAMVVHVHRIASACAVGLMHRPK